MPHRRQQIREAVAAVLVAAGTVAGARVYTTRMVPHRRAQLPAVSVYALEESVDSESRATSPRELTRRLQLAVEGAVEAAENVDDALDALALELERAMHADDTLGGLAGDVLLSSTELAVAEEGAKPIGLVRLVYEVTYNTYAPEAADVTVDDLDTLDVRYSLEGEQATADQAQDTIDVSGD